MSMCLSVLMSVCLFDCLSLSLHCTVSTTPECALLESPSTSRQHTHCSCGYLNPPMIAGATASEEEEAAAPAPNVMDNSGALASGGPDLASRGVVKMPDSESLRRSMVLEHERQLASATLSPNGLGSQAAPVSATSSGDSIVFLVCVLSCCTVSPHSVLSGNCSIYNAAAFTSAVSCLVLQASCLSFCVSP